VSATDELRRLLDERGVEWRKTPHYSSESQDNETVFAGDGIEWYANDHLNGMLGLRAAKYEVTPEQAIEATLGRGKCIYEIAAFGDGKAWFQCSECGGMASAEYDPPKYCPHCGCKVVDA